MMKKLALLFLMAMFAVSTYAGITATNALASYEYYEGADGAYYVSTTKNIFDLVQDAKVVTTGAKAGLQYSIYTLQSAVCIASANTIFIGIGQGSSTTSSFTAKYDAYIPMTRMTSGTDPATENFELDFNEDWYTSNAGDMWTVTDNVLNVKITPVFDVTASFLARPAFTYLKFKKTGRSK